MDAAVCLAGAKHVSDPFGYNLLTVLGAEDRLPTL